MQIKLKALTLLIASLYAGHIYAQAATEKKDEKKTDIGTISITGEGDRLGTGQIIQEDSAKARSTVTRSAIEKLAPTANPYQALTLVPGVNTYNHDATGLFGGGLRVRGFNSDQMGFTINGAPVNDSGSFAVFPQEYTDTENICELFVTQGSTDSEAPHVGSTGGNIGISSCDPLNVRGGKFAQTVGQLNLSRTFARLDTGLLFDRWKTYLSGSHSEADKFRGKGGADRDHIDFKTMFELAKGYNLQATWLWNKAVTNNYRSISKANYEQFGRYYDFSDTYATQPTPVNGTRQAAPTQPDQAFYKLALNPFENWLFTGAGNFQITPTARLDIEPYFWYGYGTGGVQQTTLNEGGTFKGGLKDLNGDGDRLDTVTVYRGSVTQTYRPGVTIKGSFVIDNHKILVGYWYERARHRQNQPATGVTAAGEAWDLWLRGSQIQRADGSSYQGRDTLTISTASSFFVQSTSNFMNDALQVQLGIKTPKIERDFRNFANEGANAGVDYGIVKTFDKVTPSAGFRYSLNPKQQIFANIAQNYKAPGNFSLFNTGNFVNGVQQVEIVARNLVGETSTNIDVGFRHQGEGLTLSGQVFNINFKNRLAQAFLPTEGLSIQTNVGSARSRGFEFEAGTAPVNGLSFYGSIAYLKTRIANDLVVSATNTQPTSGKEFPDSPNWMIGLSSQYAQDRWYVGAKLKYTGKRYSTLTNDESIDGFTLVDLNAGYRFGNVGMLKSATIRLNVANLFDKKYLSLSSGSGSAFTTNATGTGSSTPFYYVGAPRFTSLSVMAEF